VLLLLAVYPLGLIVACVVHVQTAGLYAEGNGGDAAPVPRLGEWQDTTRDEKLFVELISVVCISAANAHTSIPAAQQPANGIAERSKRNRERDTKAPNGCTESETAVAGSSQTIRKRVALAGVLAASGGDSGAADSHSPVPGNDLGRTAALRASTDDKRSHIHIHTTHIMMED